ncbi:DUF5682 family protein [Streptomyces sp. NPDC001822]|uniref:DUF5682 family protein n=1 Tax=Streptomyces sp. NPDC001822 TaxID=3364614 RepID=UPI003689AF60
MTPRAPVPTASRGPLLLGVRHHGPGSARAVLAALDAARPRAVLVEGPPEGDALLPLAADDGMRPPVALLAHAVDDPGRAAFWPLADFSPEWVAIRWALEHGVPVRFVDLPAANSLALSGDPEGGPDTPEEPSGSERGIDPLGILAATAGHDDPERWWEDVVEHRGQTGPQAADARAPLAPFAALAEAMTVLREAYGDGGHPQDAVREACMRLQLRAARKEFGDDIAVVCGAWHVPALATRTTVAADRSLLKGIPKVRTELTWVPWTHRRLARRSGYGAGIESPGWYGHLFGSPDRPVERWMTKVAGLLREEDRPVSPAHVIESVRLAETLAALRDRPAVGLAEATDAVRAVMCEGSDVPLALVRDRLVVGAILGEVPEGAPAVPLQRDLAGQQRSLRLRPEAEPRDLELDLRKDNDAARSRLLHRLHLLGVAWGEPVAGRGSTGTFRETWRLSWEPELFVRVAEAGVWGTTVLAAATAKAESDAVSAPSLAAVTALAERCLLAGLPAALTVVMRALSDRAALDADVGHLADALPALARSLRYGDVRSTGTTALAAVAAGIAERVCVGLPPACTGLAPESAAKAHDRLDAVHGAIGLLTDVSPTDGLKGGPTDGLKDGPADGLKDRWTVTLRRLSSRDAVAGRVRGRAARLLLDEGRASEDGTARLVSLALSPGTPPAEAAEWIEGFAGGPSGGMLLVHDERLLSLVDTWLTGIPAETFVGVLPLLRRTFAAYEPAVRRALGELARRGPDRGGAHGESGAFTPGFGRSADEARADAVTPVVRQLLGLATPEGRVAAG